MLISADDVLHLRGLSLNGLVGCSRIGLARDAIGLSRSLERVFVGPVRPRRASERRT
jgi:phage portal protein BeeE